MRYKLTSCLLFLLILATSGCGGPKKATVKGKVTLNGQPVTSGVIRFRGPDNVLSVGGNIQSDGSYEALEVPIGEVNAYYEIAAQAQAEMSSDPAEAAKAMKKDSVAPKPPASPVPQKFTSPDTSGLKYTIKSGAQDIPIELK